MHDEIPAAEQLLGHRLLSEAVVLGLAYGAAAVLVFHLARAAARNTTFGVLAAVLLVATAPRSYSYPKIVLYAAGIALLWRYIDRPSTRGAAALGLTEGPIHAELRLNDAGPWVLEIAARRPSAEPA